MISTDERKRFLHLPDAVVSVSYISRQVFAHLFISGAELVGLALANIETFCTFVDIHAFFWIVFYFISFVAFAGVAVDTVKARSLLALALAVVLVDLTFFTFKANDAIASETIGKVRAVSIVLTGVRIATSTLACSPRPGSRAITRKIAEKGIAAGTAVCAL